MNRKRMYAIWWLVLIVIAGCVPRPVDPFADIQPPTNRAYGITPETALRIGFRGTPEQNIDLTYEYIGNLRSPDGERMTVVDRVSVNDPLHEPNSGGFLGMSRLGDVPRGGILDAYSLQSESGAHRLTLYFDIYHKAPLSVPYRYSLVVDSSAVANLYPS